MITKEEILLARFQWARRPHDVPLNRVQLNQFFGVPEAKVSLFNPRQIAKDFITVHYMCNGMHKRYEW